MTWYKVAAGEWWQQGSTNQAGQFIGLRLVHHLYKLLGYSGGRVTPPFHPSYVHINSVESVPSGKVGVIVDGSGFGVVPPWRMVCGAGVYDLYAEDKSFDQLASGDRTVRGRLLRVGRFDPTGLDKRIEPFTPFITEGGEEIEESRSELGNVVAQSPYEFLSSAAMRIQSDAQKLSPGR
jgi:hypothetical protein